VEIALCPRYILEDLGFQGFGGGPLELPAKAQEKLEFNRRFLVQIDRLEIEEVRFHGKRRRGQRWGGCLRW